MDTSRNTKKEEEEKNIKYIHTHCNNTQLDRTYTDHMQIQIHRGKAANIVYRCVRAISHRAVQTQTLDNYSLTVKIKCSRLLYKLE